jgi:type IV secretory pathway VirB4 component
MASGLPTQDFIPIESIRDGVIILKNGEYRSIIMTSSINLSLKSDDEQSAIYLQFQNLLNTLEFSVQIFIQSRRLDIRPYLSVLEKRRGDVKEDLLRVQIAEYIDFIKKFTDESNIMTKHFFIVIPYAPLSTVTSSKGLGLSSPQKGGDTFVQSKMQLDQRVSIITQGLSRFGVRSAVLSTEEAVELFYKEFNPGEQDHINASLQK